MFQGSIDIIRDKGLLYFFGAAARFIRRNVFLQDVPVSPYAKWLKRNRLTSKEISNLKLELNSYKYRPTISILVPVYNTNLSHLKKMLCSVFDQIYPAWELCMVDDGSTKQEIKELLKQHAGRDPRIKIRSLPSTQGIAAASNTALSLAAGEFIGLLDHDDQLSPDALYEVVKLLNQHPDADMIYSDEDKIAEDGSRCDPFFKPDWSPDLFLSVMYTSHFGVYRKSIINEIGGFRKGYEGSQDYDLVLRLTEKTDRIFHIPKVLYHWRKAEGSAATSLDVKPHAVDSARKALEDALRRRQIAGSVSDDYSAGTYYHVQREIIGEPLVSIIIPTRDRQKPLQCCIDSIEKKNTYENYELLIVNNRSEHKSTLNYLNLLNQQTSLSRVRIINYDLPFNFSALNNFAVEHARGEYLLFLNNDTEVVAPEWLTAMLEHGQRVEVGAVGAKLLYPDKPDKKVQHAGIILGINGVAGHAFKYLSENDNRYFSNLNVIRNYSAVTAACMLMRREVFEEVGGFDAENLSVAYHDVDLCLRLRERGYLIVYTPYAVLFHHESTSRGYQRSPQEFKYMRARWGAVLDHDPYYNINLSREAEDFSLRL